MSEAHSATTPTATPLGLFDGFGVEIEMMIVDADSLDVRPVADRLMERVTGEPTAEAEFGEIAWSNELALHVLELKTNGPARSLAGLAGRFHAEIARAEATLSEMGCRLLPGGVHPWMDPETETRLWPHEYTEVYHAFDRIFSCRGHGWSNLQSTHLNLPFAGDCEFAALHSSIRGILPLLPALAASSPFLEARFAGALDARMVAYRSNAVRVPSVAGLLVPEPASSEAAYRGLILDPIYRDLAPLDPEGTLRHEWVNGRGAIARFERGSIEIRVLDPQECAAADVAVVGAVARVIQELCERYLDGDRRLDALPTSPLAGILDGVIHEGEQSRIQDRSYLEAMGIRRPGRALAAVDLWWELLDRAPPQGWAPGETARDCDGRSPLEVVLEQGPLARRLLARTGPAPDRAALVDVFRILADCLRDNRVLPGDG